MNAAGTVLVATLTGALVVATAGVSAATPTPAGAAINTGKAPCKGLPDVSGTKPGQLLAAKELEVDPELLTGARMFRVLYTTAGVSELSVEATCGLVILPAKRKDRANEIVAYAHGTIGMHQSCQPSNNPAAFLGPGLGAIAYGQGKYAVTGKAKNGIMQGLINSGRMVTATDYYSAMGEPASAQQSYVLGVPAGAAVIDSVRAGIALANGLGKKGKDPKTWKMATWGISQGGHAAFWGGQLARDYLSATRLKKQPRIKPVGVAAIVPASSFVATDLTPPDLIGAHLGDLEMHTPAQVVNGKAVGVMGPLLFSLVATSWDKYPGTGSLQAAAKFPGYPSSVPAPQMADVLTAPEQGGGLEAARTIAAGCLSAASGIVSQKYNDPATNGFFVQPVWGGPGPDGQWQGALDRTCLDPATPPTLRSWCTWLAYNQPGPDGQNPFPKIPQKADGSYADVLIAEGMADNVVWCQRSGKSVPGPQDCLARQLYDSLAAACGSASVQLDLFAKTKKSPASHTSTNDQLADNGKAAFKGSRLAKFFNGAFQDRLTPGCKATVVNKS